MATNYCNINAAGISESDFSYTYNGVAISGDYYSLYVKYNTYTENTYTGGKALVNIVGAPKVQM
jgi:hypothetical protein